MEVKLEFSISKAKVLLALLPVMVVASGSVYVLLYSTQFSVKVFVGTLTTVIIVIFIMILKNLIKIAKTPVFIIDSNGIYHKQWDSKAIPWSNIRLIWSRQYSYPKRLCIETMDQSPSDFPLSVRFSALTPGFKEAWNYIKIYHPEKLEGISRFC